MTNNNSQPEEDEKINKPILRSTLEPQKEEPEKKPKVEERQPTPEEQKRINTYDKLEAAVNEEAKKQQEFISKIRSAINDIDAIAQLKDIKPEKYTELISKSINLLKAQKIPLKGNGEGEMTEINIAANLEKQMFKALDNPPFESGELISYNPSDQRSFEKARKSWEIRLNYYSETNKKLSKLFENTKIVQKEFKDFESKA